MSTSHSLSLWYWNLEGRRASAVSPVGCHCICMSTTHSLSLILELEGRRASAVSLVGCHCICMSTTHSLSLWYWNLEGRRDNYFLLVLSSWCGTRPLSSSHLPYCLTELHDAFLSPSRSPWLKPRAHMVGKHLTPPSPPALAPPKNGRTLVNWDLMSKWAMSKFS
jgi:hypothetical protein